MKRGEVRLTHLTHVIFPELWYLVRQGTQLEECFRYSIVEQEQDQ